MTDRYALSASLVGAPTTAVTTALPERMAALAAVGRGALGLAVGGTAGGHTRDTPFLTISDIGYREGRSVMPSPWPTSSGRRRAM